MSQQLQIIDPMFAPRLANQRVPAYTRRTANYVSTSAYETTSTRPAPVQPIAQSLSNQEAEAAQPNRLASLWHRVRPQNVQASILYGMAGIVFLTGMAVSLNGMRANSRVAAQVKQVQHQADNAAAGTAVAPSTTKPSAAAIASYAVSPNVPRYLDIPKLKVHTRILSEGVTKSGQLQVPWNIYDTGWYNASSQPGQMGGMLIDGHSGIGKLHGVFYRLASLVPGDPIVVTRGDNAQFTYKVVKVQTVAVKSVDMASMLVSANTSKPGLNLITCAGDQIPGTTELNERVQVYAVQQ